MPYFYPKWAQNTPYCEISGRVQMSKTIIAVKHFVSGGRESLETAVMWLSATLSKKAKVDKCC